MEIYTPLGTVGISTEAIATIVGNAATHCFGVKGMTFTSVKDGIVYLLRREAMTTGVKIREKEGELEIELHIAVEQGINIREACRSIISEVRYNVERLTGLKVAHVEVCVEGVKA